MNDIDVASKVQEWLMQYYRQWIPLDACLELVKYTSINQKPLNISWETLEKYNMLKALGWMMKHAGLYGVQLTEQDFIDAPVPTISIEVDEYGQLIYVINRDLEM
jgi:hypothetical protein